ncbi:MAG: hypothetical protein JWM16_2542 [Verrucomicrobiales bacterium]|nr:hypothetical protein [Verrucomicrobiales bacterium]
MWFGKREIFFLFFLHGDVRKRKPEGTRKLSPSGFSSPFFFTSAGGSFSSRQRHFLVGVQVILPAALQAFLHFFAPLEPRFIQGLKTGRTNMPERGEPSAHFAAQLTAIRPLLFHPIALAASQNFRSHISSFYACLDFGKSLLAYRR